MIKFSKFFYVYLTIKAILLKFVKMQTGEIIISFVNYKGLESY